MFLQTLFALSPLCPAIIASTLASRPTPRLTSTDHELAVSYHTLTVQGTRRFRAELLVPHGLVPDAQYPGAIIIATDETRDRAFLVASRMAEIGITVLMYVQDSASEHNGLVKDAWAAVDSVRHRSDVRPEEVGVIAFEQATKIVPDLASDTMLNFAIAASSGEAVSRYTNVHAATLLVRGVKNANDSASMAHILGAPPPLRADGPDVSDTDALLSRNRTLPAPAVTVWPVPQDELKEIGDAHSPLGVRVVNWVREQVHATLTTQDEVTVPAR